MRGFTVHVYDNMESDSWGLRQSIPKNNLVEWTQTDKEERENSYETEEGADHATGRLNNVVRCSPCEGWLSDYADCRGMSELHMNANTPPSDR